MSHQSQRASRLQFPPRGVQFVRPGAWDLSPAAQAWLAGLRAYVPARAFAYCTVAGGAVAIVHGLNVASVDYIGVGVYRVNFQEELESADYAFTGSARGGGPALLGEDSGTPQRTTEALRIVAITPSTGAAVDPEALNLWIV
jgi:hypothetical protein